jgi:tripeptide aminopeptidase
MALRATIEELLPQWLEQAKDLSDLLIANIVLAGEIPALTGDESKRAAFVVGRLSESGMDDCNLDTLNTAVGRIRGTDGRRAILMATNLDTLLEDPAEQTVEVRENQLIGPFVVDNAIAIGALLTLPLLMERSDLRLRSDLWLLFAGSCHQQANLAGLKSALDAFPTEPHAGVWVESVQLGRLNYRCLGLRRGEVTCRLPDDYDWAHYGATGTIVPMADIIRKIAGIPLPRRPLTSLVLGRIQGGVHHQNIARETILGFELRSEHGPTLADIEHQLQNIVLEVSNLYGIRTGLNIFARREPGGLPVEHPLVARGRRILDLLGVEIMMYPTTSPMSALVERDIPSVTVGMTAGTRKPDLAEWDEAADIPLLDKGLTQLAALLAAMDEELYGAR